MMTTFIIYLVFPLLTLICVWLGLKAPTEKKTTTWRLVSRILILLMLAGKFVHLISRLPNFLWLTCFQVVWLVIVLGVNEVAFRKKQVTFGNPHQSHLLLAMPW